METPLKRENGQLVLAPRALVGLQRRWGADLHPRVTRSVGVSVMAAHLCRELRAEAGLSVRPARPVPHRAISKQLLSDARLLLLLAREGRPLPPLTGVKYRCGACAGCMQHPCGACDNCLDKKRFGGPGCRKRACSKRQCLHEHDVLDDAS